MQTIDIGILLSTEGTYSHLANSTLLGARHALEEINADPAYPFQLRARHINPAGELAAYSEAVSTFIAHGIRHIFGTITSASRKEIIPDLEQHNLLLWYGCPYEGSRAASRSYIWAVVRTRLCCHSCGWRWICSEIAPG